MRQYFEIVNEMVAGLFLPFKSKLLTFNEVGLSITIPKGLRVKSDEQVRKKASNRPSEPEAFYQVFFTGNEECFPLFFAANAERSFMSGVMFRLGQRSKDVAEKDYHEYLDSFWDSIEKEDNFFSRVYLERKSENITVSNVMVEKNEIATRIPERVISSLYSYHALHKGCQVVITAGFSNQGFGKKILNNIEGAVFR